MYLRLSISAAIAAAACALPAFAQQSGTVTVNVTGVHSNGGMIVANLCADSVGSFPGACGTYRTLQPAKEGTTVLTFRDVKPGSYALQLFHDEDGNNYPSIPPEGFAYGNDQPYPPDFAKSSIHVAGDASTNVKIIYLQSFDAAPATGGKGAPAPAGVTKVDLREGGLYGELYLPASDKPLPAIIALGGSEGGLQTISIVGVAFSKQGYAVLALAYFQEEGLPKTLENVPLEYFDKALDWLKKQKGIDANRIGVIGGSRGSEAALLLASRRPDIRATVAFAPSGYVWQGLNLSNPINPGPAWTAGGKALPFLTPDSAAYRPDNMKQMFINTLTKADQHQDAWIAFEKINGPVLLISGKADALWPSADMSEQIVARLKAKSFKHSVQHLSYDGAGHLVFMGDPAAAGVQAMAKAAPNPMLGGSGEANASAWADDWPKTLKFLDDALKEPR